MFLRSLTTEAMGICPSADGQSECGSKTCEMHVSQPMNIGVCYVLAAWLCIVCLFIRV